jgi:hypothetical protein
MFKNKYKGKLKCTCLWGLVAVGEGKNGGGGEFKDDIFDIL